jgi:hypothetical protein
MLAPPRGGFVSAAALNRPVFSEAPDHKGEAAWRQACGSVTTRRGARLLTGVRLNHSGVMPDREIAQGMQLYLLRVYIFMTIVTL